MATASVLWRLGRLLVASGVAEKAAVRLIERVKTMAGGPAALPGGAELAGRVAGGDVQSELGRQHARLEALEAALLEQDRRLADIAAALHNLGEELRPVLLRSAVTFWLALAALVVALVALGLALFR
jgi:hypothetical protein